MGLTRTTAFEQEIPVVRSVTDLTIEGFGEPTHYADGTFTTAVPGTSFFSTLFSALKEAFQHTRKPKFI